MRQTRSPTFDYPLSSRFDETDALITLDNVFVPWERVFIYRDVALCREQWRKTPSHIYGNYQAQIRYATKLRFLLGVMKHHCEITGVDALPASQAQLGEMAALASIVDIMVEAQETRATVENGVVWPSRVALYSVMALQSDLNPRLIDLARDLSGGAMIMLPIVAARLRESGDGGGTRALRRLARLSVEATRGAVEAGVGPDRQRVRRPPSAVREILRRPGDDQQAAPLSQLRLRVGEAARRSRAGQP